MGQILEVYRKFTTYFYQMQSLTSSASSSVRRRVPAPKELKRKTKIPDRQIRELDQIVDNMMQDGEIRRLARKEAELNKFFEKDVRLSRNEMNAASCAFDEFKAHILKELTKTTPFEWSYLNDGSYYDGTKVKCADESDCLLIPKIRNVKAVYTDAPYAQCFVRFIGRFKISEEVDILDGNYISAVKFREYVFQHLESIMKNSQFTKWERQIIYGKSPSFCVHYSDPSKRQHFDMDIVPALEIRQWPSHANSLDFLGKEESDKIKEKGFHVVSKIRKDRRLWSMAFCQAEKKLTKYADKRTPAESKTCRKKVMRILKRILEITKTSSSDTIPNENRVMNILRNAANRIRAENPKFGVNFKVKRFSTYYLRTLMWTLFYKVYNERHMWQSKSKSDRLCQTLIQLQKWLTGKVEINHFFLPELELMNHVTRKEREFIYLIARITFKMFCDR